MNSYGAGQGSGVHTPHQRGLVRLADAAVRMGWTGTEVALAEHLMEQDPDVLRRGRSGLLVDMGALVAAGEPVLAQVPEVEVLSREVL